jgi:phosphohistidine phosphatase
MKTLYIVRHAKSSWSQDGITDFERPLNNRGLHDAPIMGSRLKQRKAAPAVIRSSAAMRAITTARLLAEVLEFPLENIEIDEGMYAAGSQDIYRIVRQLPQEAHAAMLVGHNPTMHMVANRLGGFSADNLPTCGICCIDFEVATWEEVLSAQGNLRYYEYPKKVQ